MYLIRYGEIALKGKNRTYFENKLKENIIRLLKKKNIKYSKLERKRGRILLFTNNSYNELKNVFGITSVSKAIEAKLDIEDIKTKTYELIKNKSFSSFKVNARRLTKDFKLTSLQINKKLGEFIEKKTKKKVDLKNPDLEVGIEVIENNAYVFDNKTNCYSGLPVGTEGKVLTLIKNKDSLVASFLIMKRGCSIIPIAFEKKDITLIEKFSPYPLNLRIIKNIKEAEMIEKARALVVAQTLKEFKNIKTKLLVLRPLIGFSREEIEKLYNKLK